MTLRFRGSLAFALIVLIGLATAARASVVFEDGFGSADGPLVGTTPTISTGNWGQTGATTTNPIQIVSNRASLVTTGQDTFAGFASSVPHTDGNAIYTSFTLNVSAAQVAGDYIVHLSDPVGTTTAFFERIFARSATGGFQLGLHNSATTSVTYGATDLSLSTDYQVVVAWNFIAGALNDTFSLYVNPTDPVEGNNTPYLTHAWQGTGAEPAQLTAANLRQGTAANAPTAVVDNLLVTTAFADVIPEPASLSVLGLVALGLLRRRK